MLYHNNFHLTLINIIEVLLSLEILLVIHRINNLLLIYSKYSISFYYNSLMHYLLFLVLSVRLLKIVLHNLIKNIYKLIQMLISRIIMKSLSKQCLLSEAIIMVLESGDFIIQMILIKHYLQKSKNKSKI